MLDFPDGIEEAAVVRALNYTAHLKSSWSVPMEGVKTTSVDAF